MKLERLKVSIIINDLTELLYKAFCIWPISATHVFSRSAKYFLSKGHHLEDYREHKFNLGISLFQSIMVKLGDR